MCKLCTHMCMFHLLVLVCLEASFLFFESHFQVISESAMIVFFLHLEFYPTHEKYSIYSDYKTRFLDSSETIHWVSHCCTNWGYTKKTWSLSRINLIWGWLKLSLKGKISNTSFLSALTWVPFSDLFLMFRTLELLLTGTEMNLMVVWWHMAILVQLLIWPQNKIGIVWLPDWSLASFLIKSRTIMM